MKLVIASYYDHNGDFLTQQEIGRYRDDQEQTVKTEQLSIPPGAYFVRYTIKHIKEN